MHLRQTERGLDSVELKLGPDLLGDRLQDVALPRVGRQLRLEAEKTTQGIRIGLGSGAVFAARSEE